MIPFAWFGLGFAVGFVGAIFFVGFFGSVMKLHDERIIREYEHSKSHKEAWEED